MTYLRMASSSPSAFFQSVGRSLPEDYNDEKINALSNLIKSSTPGRWLIFTEFRRTAESLEKRLAEFEPSVISGDTNFGDRYLAIDNFRKKETSIVIMLPVGCEGLDLQVCSRLINYDLHWNPMVIEQRVGRIDRIGQEKTRIDIYNFIVTGSLDLHMMRIMKEKIGVVSSTFADVASLMSDSNENSELASDFLILFLKQKVSLYYRNWMLPCRRLITVCQNFLRMIFVKFTVGLRMLKNGMGR